MLVGTKKNAGELFAVVLSSNVQSLVAGDERKKVCGSICKTADELQRRD